MSGFAWGAFAANLGWAALTALGVMVITFAVAVRKGMHRIVDIAWGAAFAAVALATFGASAGEGDLAPPARFTARPGVGGLRRSVH
ncbi:hypothetical protein ACFV19_29835, partial [Streptomyces griseoluteus]